SQKRPGGGEGGIALGRLAARVLDDRCCKIDEGSRPRRQAVSGCIKDRYWWRLTFKMLEETNEPSVRQERAGHEFESLSNTEARSGGFNPGKTIVESESAGELPLPLLGAPPEFPLHTLQR